jgi:hypothetical protein
MSKPDFILIGAMKCGTSTLAAQLAQQSGVFMTTPKEPNYFSDDDVFAKGPDWYAGLFDGAQPGDLKGEASTHYTKLPTYPDTIARMRDALDKPRLIYMIRNPKTRAVSHYIHEWSEGRMDADAERAFENAPEIIDYGRYAYQIEPFVDAFGLDNVWLTSLEQIKHDPDAEFARIADFLGLKNAAWVHDMPAQNVSSERMRRLPMQGLLIDNPVAAALRRTLVPKQVRTWIRQRRTMQDRPEIPDTLDAHMQDKFLEDRKEMQWFFPDHPALELCYPFA